MENIIEDVENIIEMLTSEQLATFSEYMKPSDIEDMFTNIKYGIAEELLRRVKSKANIVYNAGWSLHGGIASSLYYEVTNDSIEIKSSKDYFNILEEGFESFDMKKSLLGKTVKVRLPGGQIINPYRIVSDSAIKTIINENPKLYRKKTKIKKKFYTTKNWIHPGYEGRHIVAQVNAQMRPWVQAYIKDTIMQYIYALQQNIYNPTIGGYKYQKRDELGRFVE